MISCEYLFHDRLLATESHVSKWHSHDFWHVDVTLNGVCRLETDRETAVPANHALLLPAGVKHRFINDRGGVENLSVKCRIDGGPDAEEPIVLPPTPLRAALVTALNRALTVPSPAANRKETAAHILAAIVHGAFDDSDPDGDASIARPIRKAIRDRNGGPLRVSEAAAILGFSPGHASTLFRRDTGRSLKEFIDECRMDIARNLVAFSDRSISQIADQTGFVDVFAFSRFFRRREGVGPREFRSRG